MCFFVARQAAPRPAQGMFRKMASPPHGARGCRAAGATHGTGLVPRHRSRQSGGLEKKRGESLKLPPELPTFTRSPPEECTQEVGGAGKRLF